MLIEKLEDGRMVMDLDGVVEYILDFLCDTVDDNIQPYDEALTNVVIEWLESFKLKRVEVRMAEHNINTLCRLFVGVFGRGIAKNKHGYYFVEETIDDCKD